MRGLKLIIALLSWLFLLPLSGQDLWNNVIITSSEDQAYATAASNIDNTVVVAGMASSAEAFTSPVRPYGGGNSDGFVAKYDDLGNLIWSTYLGSVEEDACGDVAVDELGNIYVTGYVESFWSTDEPGLPGDHQGASVGNDAFVCKLSPSGVIQWFHVFGGSNEDSGIALSYFRGQLFMVMNASFLSFEIDGTGPQGVISSANRRHYSLLAMNSETGAREWFWFLGSESHDFGAGQFVFPAQEMNRIDLEVDGSGVYVGALLNNRDLAMSSNEGVEIFEDNLSVDIESDPYLIKFDHKGTYQFSGIFTSSGNNHFYLKMALDCDRVFMTVNVDYEFFGSDYNTWLYSLSKADGSFVYSETYSTTFTSENDAIIYDLESDGKGRLLAVGRLRETLSYTLTTGSPGSLYSAGYNFFLLNIRASDGRVISSHEGGGTGDDSYFGISVSENSTVSLVGSGKQGDDIAAANTGDIGLLNGSSNILIRSRATSVADIGACCRKAGLIKTVTAEPEYFCNGETVTLSAEGDYDEINWFIVDGTTWTPIPESGPINATANVNVYAIGNLDCGIADTSAVITLLHDKTDPVFTDCPLDLTVDTDPGTCEYVYSFVTPIATDNCAPPTVTRTDGNGWNSGDALPIGIHIFSYLATDEGGRTATCAYQVSVKDSQAPIPDNVFPVTTSSQCSYSVTTFPTATDDCAGTVVGTTSDPLSYSTGGTYVITWTYDDGNGNTTIQTQNVSIDDTAANISSCAPDITVVNDAGDCGAIVSNLGSLVTDPTCGSDTIYNDAASTFFPVGDTDVTWTYEVESEAIYTPESSPLTNCLDLAPYFPRMINSTGTAVRMDDYALVVNAADQILTTQVLTDQVDGTYGDNTNCNGLPCATSGTWAPALSLTRSLGNGSGGNISAGMVISTDYQAAQIDLSTSNDTLFLNDGVTLSSQDRIRLRNGAHIIVSGQVNIHCTQLVVQANSKIELLPGASLMIFCQDYAWVNGASQIVADSPEDIFIYSVNESWYEDGALITAYAYSEMLVEINQITLNPDTTVFRGRISAPIIEFYNHIKMIDEGSAPCLSVVVGASPEILNNNGDPYAIQVPENYDGLVLDFNGSDDIDAEGSGLTWSMSGPDAAWMTLDPVSGHLSFTNAPDFEYPQDVDSDNIYSLTIRLSDQNANTDEINLEIEVLDISPLLATCTQTVTVTDQESPVPDAASLPNIVEECSATVNAPTATDNCSGSITGTTTDPLTYSSEGTYTITWTYDDGNGNTSSQSQTVTVDDTTAPVPDIASLPTAIGECAITVSAPTATDNCSGSITGTTSDPLTYNSQGTYTITWTYDDGNGNTSSQSQTVTVDDTTAPVPDIASLPTATGECAITVSAPTATDNCSGSITGTTSDPLTYNSQGTYTITWTYEDGNGNTSSQSQTVTVDDTTSPTPDVATLPTSTGECSVTVSSVPTATDNCSGSIIGTTSDPLTYNSQGTYTITWTYEDGNGNTSSQSQTVTVDDTTSPTPDVATLPTSTGECSVTVSSVPTATDNCSGSIIGTTSDPLIYNSQGTYTITWTYDDGNGNTSLQSQTVTVDDTTSPTPDVATLPTSTGECSVTVSSVPTATDNCSGSITGTTTDPLTYSSEGTYTITWTYDDGNGNTSSQSQTVTVDDTTAPVPDIVSLPTATGECAITVSAPTATDNCSGSITGTTSDPLTYNIQGTYTITWTYDDGNGNTSQQVQTVIVDDVTAPVPDVANLPTIVEECSATISSFPTATDACSGPITATTSSALSYGASGTYTITWMYVDDYGNSSAQDQQVLITDTESPTISLPSGGTISENSDSGQCGAVVTWSYPIISDNCTVQDTVTWGALSGSFLSVGVHYSYYQVSDLSGNIAIDSLVITVEDNEAPIVGSMTNLDVYTDLNQCGAIVNWMLPEISDNCAVVDTNVFDNWNPTGPALPGEFFPVGSSEIRIIATDAAGRDDYVQFHLNVIDGQDPVFLSFPNDTTVFTDAGECHATVFWNIPTYDDNCAVTQVNSTDDPGDLFNTGTHVVEYSIRDAEGNETLQSFTITVQDNEDPVITACPSSTAFPFDGNCELVLPDLTSSVDAQDNCTSDGGIIITQLPLPGAVINSTTTLSMTATDEAGNTATCSLDIIFNESTSPVPDLPSLPDITGQCSAEITAEPTATDNCDGTIVGTTTDPLVYSSQGTYTITWVYEDGNGNSSTQNQTVIVDDNTAPVPDVANLPTITEECSAAVQRPSATDNCAGTIIGQTSDPLTYTAQGTYTITWIYDDGNGNSNSQTQMVIIDDVTAPLPDNGSLPTSTAECSVTATAPTATDNCEGPIIATTTDPLTYNAQGTYTITWIYDDGNGNSSAQNQTVIISDVTAPMPDVSSLPVVNGECSATASIPTAMDNCEGTITGTTSDPLTYTEQGIYTITWTYDDGNGNSSQQTQTILVDDVTAPVPDVTSLPDVVAECSVMVLEPTASDNCEGPITGTTTDPTSFTDQGTYSITWTYDDGNGNTSVQTQTVIIDDTTAPIPAMTTLPDVTGQCSATATAPMANDNCEGMIIGTTSDPLSYSTQGTFTITWTYDDGNGNTSVQTQSVIIQDTEDPVLLSTPMDIERNLDGNCEYVLEDLTGLISATDACDTDLDIVQSPPSGQVFSGAGTIIALTFTVTDDAGNVLNTGFSVELIDGTSPVISCPSMLIVDATPGTCSAVVVFSDPSATDACGTASVLRTDAIALNSGDEFPVGLTVLTYQATDESGNTSNCSYSILVRDEDGPIITGPATDSPEYDEMCGVELMNYADLLTYSDGCSPFESLISSQSPAVGSVITGPTLVTVTILDGAGNASDHDVMVTPIDVTAPVFSPMSDVMRPLAGLCQYLMEDFTGMVGVSDNCSATLTLSQSPAVNTEFFGHGTIVPVTIYAEDDSGNVDSLTFNVELEDVTPPSIDCPNDTTVYSTAASCDVFIDMEVAVAYDACQTVFPINNYNGTGEASDFYGLGNTFLSWSTTDNQNFLSTCVQIVTVIDTIAPVIDEISEVVVDMFGCTYELGDLSANIMVTDNCTEAEVLSITQNPIGGQISGPTYLEFIVTDASGNSSMTGFTVVPVNVVAPVMDCYGTLSAILPEDECEVDVNVPAPSATDDCGDATVVNTINGTDELTLSIGLGEQVVTWIATDAEGNSSECTITVIVTPEVPVSMTCPGNISAIAAATDCGSEIEVDLPEVNGFCSFVLSNDFNGTDNASGYYEVGTTEVTFTATGSATASCSFTVEVLDISAPEMTCPEAIEQCGAEVDVDQPILNDACGISTLVNDLNGLEDASGTYSAGETIVTWTATDLSGNTNTCTTTVVVAEMDIEVDAGPDAILDFAFEHQLQATLPTGATGTWSCENQEVSFSDVNDSQASVDGLALGNNVLTWTVDHGLCGVMQDEVQVFTRQFLIPTGFSPNGDNVNDKYVIRGLASLGGVAIQVFDRWGLEVYASDDYDNSWDGISPLGKMLPTGTYFYIITLKERDEILRGSLELKR